LMFQLLSLDLLEQSYKLIWWLQTFLTITVHVEKFKSIEDKSLRNSVLITGISIVSKSRKSLFLSKLIEELIVQKDWNWRMAPRIDVRFSKLSFVRYVLLIALPLEVWSSWVADSHWLICLKSNRSL
jgi:hypothetical protein